MTPSSTILKRLLIVGAASSVAVLATAVGPAQWASESHSGGDNARAAKIVLAQFVPCPNGNCRFVAAPKPP